MTSFFCFCEDLKHSSVGVKLNWSALYLVSVCQYRRICGHHIQQCIQQILLHLNRSSQKSQRLLCIFGSDVLQHFSQSSVGDDFTVAPTWGLAIRKMSRISLSHEMRGDW